jgi:hypothetical protein
MAARDRYEIDLNCPKCGKTGSAKISEDDHPWLRGDIGRRVDELSEGFSSFIPGTNSAGLQIYCLACKETVWPQR